MIGHVSEEIEFGLVSSKPREIVPLFGIKMTAHHTNNAISAVSNMLLKDVIEPNRCYFTKKKISHPGRPDPSAPL